MPRATAPASPPCAASPVMAAPGHLLCRAGSADEPVRECAVLARPGTGRCRLLDRGAPADVVRRGAGDAQAGQRVLPAVLRVRSRAAPTPLGDRESARRRHHSPHLRAKAAWAATVAARPRARRSDRRPRPDVRSRRHARLARLDGRCLRRPPRSVRTDPEDVALLHFTSGTTGMPKGAVHVHEAVVAHQITGKLVLDLQPGDVFWCTADPGWVTGTSYGIIAPLTNGVTSIVDEGEFDAGRWYHTLERESVIGVVHGADRDPHADEGRNRAWPEHALPGASLPGQRRRAAQPRGGGLGSRGLRHAVSRQLVADRDGRHHDRELSLDGDAARVDGPAAPGSRSRGRAAAATTAASTSIDEPDVEGELALHEGWPSMFRAISASPSGTASALRRLVPHRRPRSARRGRLLLVRRPRGRRDQDLRPSGRPLRGRERPDGASGRRRSGRDRQARPGGRRGHQGVRRRSRTDSSRPTACGASCWRSPARGWGRSSLPRRSQFVASVPRTRSGKIMRRLLKARELGLPEGDTSTLEETR